MQTLNRYFLRRATIVYIISLLVVLVAFSSHFMQWYWALMGLLEVTLFYFLSTTWELSWKNLTPKSFEKKLFLFTLITRVLWVLGFYWFTMSVWHTPWEQPIGTSMDSYAYFDESLWLAEMIRLGDISPYLAYVNPSDAGYPVFLTLWGFITKSNILLTRLPNIFFDSWTVILTYRIAKRNFDEKTGRLAAIFTLLLPQLLFYTGVTMKESLMLMLTMWALERGDSAIRQDTFKVLSIIEFVLISLLLSFFRTALAWVIVLAFLCALVLSSERIMKASRRWIIIITIALAGVTIFGGTIIEQAEDLFEQVDSEGKNFEYRANRRGGNSLVANLSQVVFAPIMFTLPFPTMVEIEGQNIQQLQNGGYYLKNILSFFCIFSLFVLLLTKKWRGNVLIIAFLLGYLMVLALSSFAQSGRFHHPVIPMELIFASYGINCIKNRKQASWFDIFLLVEFVVIVFWNWFKLKGRGLV